MTLTATPNGPGANIALSWGTVASSTYRVYYRRNGTTPWYLYQDSVATTSLVAMDNIALGVAYDFAVSAVNATPAEGAKSGTQTATIPLGSYSAYLHIIGNGPTYGVPFQVQGSPTIAEKIDGTYLMGFGQGAPIVRYGTSDYRTVGASALLVDATPATLKALQAILDQIKAGGVAQYRDALGGMLTVAIDASQGVTVLPPWYRQASIAMTEIPNLAGPYVAAGSAQGYLALVNGRKPPLDTSERLL
jgi:hypothetical protein